MSGTPCTVAARRLDGAEGWFTWPVLDGQNMQLTLGESQVLQLPQPVSRVAVGHPGIADFILLGDYVASGAYRGASFAAYKQTRQKRGS